MKTLRFLVVPILFAFGYLLRSGTHPHTVVGYTNAIPKDKVLTLESRPFIFVEGPDPQKPHPCDDVVVVSYTMQFCEWWKHPLPLKWMIPVNSTHPRYMDILYPKSRKFVIKGDPHSPTATLEPVK